MRRNKEKVRKTARFLGVSPGTVINWRERAKEYEWRQLRYLEHESTRPDRCRGRIFTPRVQEDIADLRDRTGFEASKLKYPLKIPAHWITVHRFLKRWGRIHKQINHRRPKIQETRHMHVKNALVPGKLQMDVKHVTPQLSGLPHTVYLHAIMDIFSRYKQGVILPFLDQENSLVALKHLVPLFPIRPDFIQTDNGLKFQAGFHEFVTETLR